MFAAYIFHLLLRVSCLHHRIFHHCNSGSGIDAHLIILCYVSNERKLTQTSGCNNREKPCNKTICVLVVTGCLFVVVALNYFSLFCNLMTTTTLVKVTAWLNPTSNRTNLFDLRYCVNKKNVNHCKLIGRSKNVIKHKSFWFYSLQSWFIHTLNLEWYLPFYS